MEEFENQAVNALALQDITSVQVFAEVSETWEGVGWMMTKLQLFQPLVVIVA